MKKRVYHGWIFAEKNPGFKDHFSVQFKEPDPEALDFGRSNVIPTGSGEKGAAAAVDYFETRLKLGLVKLEQTPLGLRVFTEEEEEEKK